MLRDRRSLAVMFGLPLVLYPMLAIGIATLTHSKIQQQTEKTARVAVVNAEDAPELAMRLAGEKSGIVTPQLALTPEQALVSGDVDAVVVVPKRAQDRAVAGEAVEITLRLDRSRTASPFAERKIDKVMADYERWVLEQRLKRFNAPP